MDEGFVRVAELSEVPPGSIKGVVYDGTYIAIYNLDGTIYATRDCCCHQAYPLSKGRIQGKTVTCALHFWEFDIPSGEYLGNPAIKVKTFPVEVADGEIFVKI